MPSLRYEIGVCLTVTVIAALAAFDIVYVTTGGGPGNATAVPGIQIYILAFLERQVGLASALAVVLMFLVLIVDPADPAAEPRGASDEGRPQASSIPAGCSSWRWSPSRSCRSSASSRPRSIRREACPSGLGLARRSAMGQLRRGVQGRQHERAARVEHRSSSSPSCRSPWSSPRWPGSGSACCGSRARGLLLLLFVFGLTLPFEGIITPLYFLARGMGILNTRLAIVLPLIGLFMPFAVFWMRAHFVNMPSEISEAARVDGASTWDLFWRIHVPLARATHGVARDPHVGLGMEPVPARAGPRGGPDTAHDGRRARRLPRATTRRTSRCSAPGRS